jgi:glucose/mannose-6-phosphate isomerase
MMDLDQRPHYEEIDRAGMLNRILGLPQQIREAWAIMQGQTFPSDLRNARHIVICGMGGSAIGGDLTRAIVEPEARCPVQVVRGYDLPRYVGRESLVILSSFSGTTEEVLSAAHQALAVQAKVIGITTGGEVARLGKHVDFPVVTFDFDGTPREAIGYSTFLMLGLLTRLGYVSDQTTQVEATAQLIEQMFGEIGPDVHTDENEAKRLAQLMSSRVVVFYGGGHLSDVARRWKGQLNENAKSWAFFEQLPELNHNAVLGYKFPAEAAQRMMVVILSSSLNHPRIAVREALTKEELERRGVQVRRIEAQGSSRLEHVMSTVAYGDMVSYYLALVHEVDPNEMDVLNFFKARLQGA